MGVYRGGVLLNDEVHEAAHDLRQGEHQNKNKDVLAYLCYNVSAGHEGDNGVAGE